MKEETGMKPVRRPLQETWTWSIGVMRNMRRRMGTNKRALPGCRAWCKGHTVTQ